MNEIFLDQHTHLTRDRVVNVYDCRLFKLFLKRGGGHKNHIKDECSKKHATKIDTKPNMGASVTGFESRNMFQPMLSQLLF